MSRATMELCLAALDRCEAETVDLTGGAPEMNPHFRWFVERVRERGKQVIVRSNLTILVANALYRELPEFFARHKVQVVSSLPCYGKENTDRQRGDGVFERSIAALKLLNEVGYGEPGSGLELNLVYNPGGAFLPPPQAGLEEAYHRELHERFGIRFNRLFTITNMAIARFREDLLAQGKLGAYEALLEASFNPQTVESLMCRSTLSVSWDGFLHDCDFNQMLDLKLRGLDGEPLQIATFQSEDLKATPIITRRHCFGCTAGSGSSCTGSLAS